MDGKDNDGDGKFDCDDEECKLFTFCQSANQQEELTENTLLKCTDGEDNDKNGLLDCLDPNCRTFEVCTQLIGVKENTRELCSDDIDNDYDGVKDKDDPNCKLFYAAGGQYGEGSVDLCKNSKDDDGDGVMDCDDPECQVYDFCFEKDYKADKDECKTDPFKYKKDKCQCGETLVGDDCYTNIAIAEDFDTKINTNKTKYILKQNIEFGTTDRAPIASFKGILDGNNKRITGVFNQTADCGGDISCYCGLIKSAGTTDAPATFKNIDIAITLNCDNKANPEKILYAGAISGSVYASAGNITGSSKVYVEEKDSDTASDTTIPNHNKYIGGLFGYVNGNGQIADVTLTGNVSAYLPYTNIAQHTAIRIFIGGLAGAGGVYSNIHANNYVTLNRKVNIYEYVSYIGGIVGWLNMTSDDNILMTNVSNQGVIKHITNTQTNDTEADYRNNGTYIGGIVGSLNNGIIKDASFSGIIETSKNRGDSTREKYYGLNIGGIVGVINSETNKPAGVDHSQVDAEFRVVAENSAIGGIAGRTMLSGSYIRNCTTKIDLDLLDTGTYKDSAYYGGIVGVSAWWSWYEKIYIVNNSARTHYIQTRNHLPAALSKKFGGISGAGGTIVNNFASDKITCSDPCDYMPKAIGGSYIYESYWNKDIFDLESGADYYSDASAEPYTFNIDGIPVIRTASTVLGLLRYNSAHDGGVLSAHIPGNDGEIYYDWTTENDSDGHVIPIPADK